MRKLSTERCEGGGAERKRKDQAEKMEGRPKIEKERGGPRGEKWWRETKQREMEKGDQAGGNGEERSGR